MKKIFLFILLGFFSATSYAQKDTHVWKLYGVTETNTDFCYYDTTSIEVLPNGHFIIWTKVQTNPDSLVQQRNALIETRDRLKLYEGSENPRKNTLNRYAKGYYEKWLYTVSKNELDCDRKKIVSLTTIDYDDKGIELGRVNDPAPQRHWMPIRPGLVEETLRSLICK